MPATVHEVKCGAAATSACFAAAATAESPLHPKQGTPGADDFDADGDEPAPAADAPPSELPRALAVRAYPRYLPLYVWCARVVRATCARVVRVTCARVARVTCARVARVPLALLNKKI